MQNISKPFFSLIVLSLFFLSNIAFAQEQASDMGDELNPFVGLKKDNNFEHRKQFYGEKVRNLYENTKSPEDREMLLVEDFSFSIDESLGIDFSKEKKDELRICQYSMLKQKSSLDKLHEKGLLGEDLYVEHVADIVEQSWHEASDILSEEEFEVLFGLKKNQIDGFFYKIMNIGRSEHEWLIDTRKKE